MANIISPLDGRYHSKTKELCQFFSEKAFFKYRLFVELKYFLQLIDYLDELKDLNKIIVHDKLIRYYQNFSDEDYNTVKKYEFDTNHDIKALEYYIQTIFITEGLAEYIPFIHFGLTSQDINTSANILSLKDSMNNVVKPFLHKIVEILDLYNADMSKNIMLSFTHGQPAVPTTMGKELNVYKYRLNVQLDNLNHAIYSTKFGGAVGNFNAHKLAYPNIDWNDFADKFIHNELELVRETYTTQISNYDNICNIFNQIKCINNIINDLNIDCWLYISKGYLKQRINTNETGSSTMPHKVNPINFENSEGNICIANSLIEGITRKLPISRLQRDLTDSTILRNIGCVIGYSLLSYKSTLEGLQKIQVDNDVIKNELHKSSIVLSEGVQTVMRKHKINDSYEKLKKLTRLDKEIKSDDIQFFIHNLDDKIQNELKHLTVENYIGYSGGYIPLTPCSTKGSY
tara:strand:+ start:278 stop:1651 length:1374 start_codon:yes stop_codon:yes gene_type:complete